MRVESLLFASFCSSIYSFKLSLCLLSGQYLGLWKNVFHLTSVSLSKQFLQGASSKALVQRDKFPIVYKQASFIFSSAFIISVSVSDCDLLNDLYQRYLFLILIPGLGWVAPTDLIEINLINLTLFQLLKLINASYLLFVLLRHLFCTLTLKQFFSFPLSYSSINFFLILTSCYSKCNYLFSCGNHHVLISDTIVTFKPLLSITMKPFYYPLILHQGLNPLTSSSILPYFIKLSYNNVVAYISFTSGAIIYFFIQFEFLVSKFHSSTTK